MVDGVDSLLMSRELLAEGSWKKKRSKTGGKECTTRDRSGRYPDVLSVWGLCTV